MCPSIGSAAGAAPVRRPLPAATITAARVNTRPPVPYLRIVVSSSEGGLSGVDKYPALPAGSTEGEVRVLSQPVRGGYRPEEGSGGRGGCLISLASSPRR